MTVTKEQWNAFVKKTARDGGLLQSWEWGMFQEARGRRIWREVVWDGGAIAALALAVEHPLPFRWTYLYVPRGPLGQLQIVEKLIQRAKAESAIFLRIEPDHTTELPEASYPVRPGRPLQADTTLRINLRSSEDELLAAMHEKTRYNVRLAERKGVNISDGIRRTDLRIGDALNTFFALSEETATRNTFRLHERAHYAAMVEHLETRIFIASRNDEPLAAALVVSANDTAYYMHGASTQRQKGVMAPYAMHWAIMKDAKARGIHFYDLWGCDEKRWPGFSRFKRGFAPNTPSTDYPGAFDYVLSPMKRTLFQFVRSMRRKTRVG